MCSIYYVEIYNIGENTTMKTKSKILGLIILLVMFLTLSESLLANFQIEQYNIIPGVSRSGGIGRDPSLIKIDITDIFDFDKMQFQMPPKKVNEIIETSALVNELQVETLVPTYEFESPALREKLRYYWYTTPMEISEEDYELLCNVVDLEIGGEPRESQMLVTTTIRNAIESGLFGSTVKDIIYRPGFYEVMDWLWKANPSETTREVVTDVFHNGIMACDKSVIYFRLWYYHQWNGCYPAFQDGNVCYSYSSFID